MYFGLYLMRRGVITVEDFFEALDRKSASRPRLGAMALKAGKMTVGQLFQVLDRQAQTSEPFGRIAVELGFLSEGDLAALLADQRRGHQSLLKFLIDMGAITPERAQSERDRYAFEQAETGADRTGTTSHDGGDLAEMVAVREARAMVADLRRLSLENDPARLALLADSRTRLLSRLVLEVISPDALNLAEAGR